VIAILKESATRGERAKTTLTEPPTYEEFHEQRSAMGTSRPPIKEPRSQ
jgi:hypothetical protein